MTWDERIVEFSIMITRTLQKIYHQLCPRIVVTKKLDGLWCRVNINDHLQWLLLPEQKSIEQKTYAWIDRAWGTVWDVGSNFGFFSLVSAKRGNQTIAFDMSPSALALLAESSRRNNLDVKCVPRAVTAAPRTYVAPQTGACTNAIVDAGECQSLTYKDAAGVWGVPNFIKMDIEGGEREFLESHEFLEWLIEQDITLYVELHNGYRISDRHFRGLDVEQIDGNHCVVRPSAKSTEPPA
jgi:FkbM family methyltransferase